MPRVLILSILLVLINATQNHAMESLDADEVPLETTTEMMTTESSEVIDATTPVPINPYVAFFGYGSLKNNTDIMVISDVSLPKPAVISESTLRGDQWFAVEPFLFGNPKLLPSLHENLRNAIKMILRLPVVAAAWFIGHQVELLGLTTMSISNRMILAGARGFGEC